MNYEYETQLMRELSNYISAYRESISQLKSEFYAADAEFQSCNSIIASSQGNPDVNIERLKMDRQIALQKREENASKLNLIANQCELCKEKSFERIQKIKETICSLARVGSGTGGIKVGQINLEKEKALAAKYINAYQDISLAFDQLISETNFSRPNDTKIKTLFY